MLTMLNLPEVMNGVTEANKKLTQTAFFALDSIHLGNKCMKSHKVHQLMEMMDKIGETITNSPSNKSVKSYGETITSNAMKPTSLREEDKNCLLLVKRMEENKALDNGSIKRQLGKAFEKKEGGEIGPSIFRLLSVFFSD